MLRPTVSRILWLQQFGRGLRWLPGKTLRVIETIGNHRVFLNKTRALFDLGNADREVGFALERLEAGTMELPRRAGQGSWLDFVGVMGGDNPGQADALRHGSARPLQVPSSVAHPFRRSCQAPALIQC